MGGVTIREVSFGQMRYVDRTYTDDEIRELFSNDGTTLVIALLDRAVEAETERDRLRELLRRFGAADIAWQHNTTNPNEGEYFIASGNVRDEARRIAAENRS